MKYSERYNQVKTVVEYMIQIGMLELDACDGIDIYYDNGNVKEVHKDELITHLSNDEIEYSRMCQWALYEIAKAN